MCHLKEHYATLLGSSDYTKVALPQHTHSDVHMPRIAPCWQDLFSWPCLFQMVSILEARTKISPELAQRMGL